MTVQSYEAWAHSASLFILTTPDGANLPGSASESNFPLLLRLNANNFNFGEAQTDGRDLRFTIATGATIPYQIEQWDAANSTASIWVKIPTITGNVTITPGNPSDHVKVTLPDLGTKGFVRLKVKGP